MANLWTPPSPQPPEDIAAEHYCPHCGELLYVDWMWGSDFDEAIIGEEDYHWWYLACEFCEAWFTIDDDDLIECT